MKAQATLRLNFPSQEDLAVAYAALMPEAEKPASSRFKVKLKIEGQFLILVAEARDTVALRAALNAYLRWINSILQVITWMRSQKD